MSASRAPSGTYLWASYNRARPVVKPLPMNPASVSLWILDVLQSVKMGVSQVVLLVMCFGLVFANRRMTIYEKLREDGDLSQVLNKVSNKY